MIYFINNYSFRLLSLISNMYGSCICALLVVLNNISVFKAQGKFIKQYVYVILFCHPGFIKFIHVLDHYVYRRHRDIHRCSPKSKTNVIENKLTRNWRISLFSITLVWLFGLIPVKLKRDIKYKCSGWD